MEKDLNSNNSTNDTTDQPFIDNSSFSPKPNSPLSPTVKVTAQQLKITSMACFEFVVKMKEYFCCPSSGSIERYFIDTKLNKNEIKTPLCLTIANQFLFGRRPSHRDLLSSFSIIVLLCTPFPFSLFLRFNVFLFVNFDKF